MSIVKSKVSLKEMTEDQKKQHKREQMREYMNRRRKEDPEFAEKLRENCRKAREKKPNPKDGYDADKRKEYNINYYNKKKEQLKELEELKRRMEISNYSLKIDSVSYF